MWLWWRGECVVEVVGECGGVEVGEELLEVCYSGVVLWCVAGYGEGGVVVVEVELLEGVECDVGVVGGFSAVVGVAECELVVFDGCECYGAWGECGVQGCVGLLLLSFEEH